MNTSSDISMRIKEQKGFQVLPKRWVVERTFAWLNCSHRLSKDYETSCCSAETMIMISHAATLLKCLWTQALSCFFKENWTIWFMQIAENAFGN